MNINSVLRSHNVLLPGLESVADEVRSIRIDAAVARIEEIAAKVSSGPWIHDDPKNIGNNWLIADFGIDTENGKWLLTTDHVHASEFHGDPQADAEFCAIARTLLPLLIEERKVRQ